MSAITWTEVDAIAPELSTTPAAAQTAILALVNEFAVSAWGTEARLLLGRSYYAAHLASATTPSATVPSAVPAGPMTSKTEGGVTVSYAAPSSIGGSSSLGDTMYGRMYALLLKSAPARGPHVGG